MAETLSAMSNRKPPWFRRVMKKLLLLFLVLVAIGVSLPYGCVGNRVFNPERESYLKTHRTEGGVPFAVAVVEFDDQGEPWDVRQLTETIDLIREYNAASPDGVVLFQFIHGWKQNASREDGAESRLAWFERYVESIARYSDRESVNRTGPQRPVIGLYVGWRGRTYSLPILIDASFWNRRVAAHRVASMRLNEVLYRTVNTAKENSDSKCVLMGHSMGGLILEKTIGPATVTQLMSIERQRVPTPVDYDLIISANPSIEALYSKQLVDILKRSQARLVLESESGVLREAKGPLLASVTSEDDAVSRWIFPFAMRLNSIFVRYRNYSESTKPSQKQFAIRTAGESPYLHSHRVEVRDGEIEFHEIPDRWNDTPFWIFQVPRQISSHHSDIDSPMWSKLMLQLMDMNDVFNPNVERMLTSGTAEN
ncbi:MAG: hypothetical protein GY906_00135 [bacterium]|nr:hypothetical protein [bacterium]